METLQCQVITKKELIRTPIFSVEEKMVENSQGKILKRLVVQKKAAVVLIPMMPNGDVLFVKQWRAGTEEVMQELPAGVIDVGETPFQAAQRELREETGYRSEKLTLLGSSYSSPGFCNELFYFYLAEMLCEDPLPADEDEKLNLLNLTLQEALRHPMVCRDAKSWLGLLAAEQHFHQSAKRES